MERLVARRDDPVCRLAAFVELAVPAGVVVGRVQDGMVEEGVGHCELSNERSQLVRVMIAGCAGLLFQVDVFRQGFHGLEVRIPTEVPRGGLNDVPFVVDQAGGDAAPKGDGVRRRVVCQPLQRFRLRVEIGAHP